MSEEEPSVELATQIHIAGTYIGMGPRLRQRCGWCGAMLIDNDIDLNRIAPDGLVEVSFYEVGRLVAFTDAGDSWIVTRDENEPLPPTCCMSLDAEATA